MSTRGKILVFLVAIVMSCAMCFGGYYLTSLLFEHDKAEILKNRAYAIGVIVNKQSGKSRRIYVEYFAKGRIYTYGTAVKSEDYRKYKIGDEIELIYNGLDPAQAMLKTDFEPGELEKRR